VAPGKSVSGTVLRVSVTPGWTFLSNHGHVLLAVVADPTVRIRDVAEQIGITERAVQLILNDLVDAGYVERTRVGRRNSYRVHTGRPFRHPAEAARSVDELIRVFRPNLSDPHPEPGEG
jgi:DNA-binding IclR family transcriptional regulator